MFWLLFGIFLLACFAAGATGGLFPPGQWYRNLNKPGWTPVFFGLKRIKLGMFVLVALWLSVAATMWALFQVDTIAGLLFAPYLLWVTIAGALNGSVWRLNRKEANTPRPAAT
jgi:tryptophan-rich sensory protein